MYLLTFVVLIISLIGLYAQILTVQTTRLAGQQTAIGQAMLDWHSAAVSMAASIIDTNNSTPPPGPPGVVTTSYQTMLPGGPTGGCSLSPFNMLPIATVPFCPAPYNSTANTWLNTGAGEVVSGNQIAICPPTGTGAAATPCNTVTGWQTVPMYLPPRAPGTVLAYQFYSILFQSGAVAGNDLVVTFVPDAVATSTNPAGLLTLADGTQIGVTPGDLLHQLSNAAGQSAMFGHMTDTVVGQPPVVHAYQESNAAVAAGATSFQYTLPTTFNCTSLPCPLNGAIAIVSSPDGL